MSPNYTLVRRGKRSGLVLPDALRGWLHDADLSVKFLVWEVFNALFLDNENTKFLTIF